MTPKNTRKPITMKDYTKQLNKILNSCLPIEDKIQALCDEASKWRITGEVKDDTKRKKKVG
ncbi:hypothetical protein CCP1ISM_50025 [Azospirillaceae bacterium]